MRQTHVRMLNDTLTPLNAVCLFEGEPYDWTSKTASFVMEEEDGTSVSLAGTCTAHPTQSFTADATTDRITCNGHGVKAGQQVVVATSGTLPGGLAASTRYFAIEVTANSFSLNTQPDGAPIDITSAGSGTHTFYVVGSVQFDFAAADVDTVGFYRGWFKSTASSETQHFPDDEYGIPIEIKAFGN